MSLILDALKKLEREKAAQSSKTSDIAASILEQKPAVRSRRPMVLIGALALTAAVSMAGMYVAFLMNNKPAPLSTSAQPAPAPQPKTGPAQAETSAPLPVAAEPVKASPVTAGAPPAAVKVPSAAVKESSVKEKVVPDKPKRGQPEKKASETPPGATPARPDFIISALIWFDEPSERRAVINGKSVREGDIIDGFRVEHIHPSYVRFVKNGKPFEVNMNR